jgi:hypothetical protein
MLPFQRTFISSYPKATQDTHPAANSYYNGFGQLVKFENSLCLIHLFLTERLRIFNPSLRVARGRQAVKKPLFH